MQLERSPGSARNKAPITPLDQARLDGLNFTAKALLRVGTEPSRLLREMAEQIAVIECEGRRKVVFRDGTRDGVWFAYGPSPGQDYAQVAKPNEVRTLRARVRGVSISLNLMKPGAYDHDNDHVASALRSLADAIDRAPVRLADQDVELPLD